jgi:thiamine pyrophosphokinase
MKGFEEIRLPQVVLSSPQIPPGEEVLLVAGGRKPRVNWLLEAAENRTVWAIDRGVNACMEAGLLPALILGDADSASPKLWKAAMERGAEVMSLSREKDDTDFQVALKALASRSDGVKILVTGCWGGRFDHAWSNVLSVLGNLRGSTGYAVLADHRELLTFIRGGESVTLTHLRKPEAVSLLAFSKQCKGVTIRGVHWPLEKTELDQDFPYAISNRPEGEEPTVVGLDDGEMGLYVSWWER